MFKAHEIIIKRSEYLLGLWNFHKAANGPTSPIEITDILARDFEGILNYLYTDDDGFINSGNIIGIYTAGFLRKNK